MNYFCLGVSTVVYWLMAGVPRLTAWFSRICRRFSADYCLYCRKSTGPRGTAPNSCGPLPCFFDSCGPLPQFNTRAAASQQTQSRFSESILSLKSCRRLGDSILTWRVKFALICGRFGRKAALPCSTVSSKTDTGRRTVLLGVSNSP